jgi:hypothetical protein
LRKALASTRKILPPLNTSYVKGRGSSTCILLQELGIYAEGGHTTMVINFRLRLGHSEGFQGQRGNQCTDVVPDIGRKECWAIPTLRKARPSSHCKKNSNRISNTISNSLRCILIDSLHNAQYQNPLEGLSSPSTATNSSRIDTSQLCSDSFAARC